MKEYQRTNYEEIEIKNLFLTLWRKKIIIISITLTAAILAGILSKLLLSPVYDTKLNIVISMPEKYDTRYGEYELPIHTNEQFISLIKSNNVLLNTIRKMNYDDMSIEGLAKRIYIYEYDTRVGAVQNSFEVDVSSDNPEESLRLAESLYNNYMEFIDVMIKERAISYFINTFSISIKTLNNSLISEIELLSKNENLLQETPRNITNDLTKVEIQTDLTDGIDYVVPMYSVNPNYIKIENDIIKSRQKINEIENSINMQNRYLKELEVEKQAIEKYYETGQAEKLDSSVISVVNASIYMPSPPVAPTIKTSPNNVLNAFIGAVIGGMISVVFVLVKEYWFKEV